MVSIPEDMLDLLDGGLFDSLAGDFGGLDGFDGAALETYWSDGQRYYISARARDKKRTRYELEMSIIREAKNQS